MVFRKIKLTILLIIQFIISGCVELGDLLVREYKLSSAVSLKEFDGNFLSSDVWGSSDMCLNRRSRVGMKQYVGICLDKQQNTLVIYRAFENKFYLREKGITKELVNSIEYKEFVDIEKNVEVHLKDKNINFVKQDPIYLEFNEFSKRFNFYR